jgi:hypothetical protein
MNSKHSDDNTNIRQKYLLINITICFGDFNFPICRGKAQNIPDPLVESSTWPGKTPFEVPDGNGEFFNFFPYCHNCCLMAQNQNGALGIGAEGKNLLQLLSSAPHSPCSVVSYKQRKSETSFQSLSPLRGEVWRGVKIYGSR